MSRPSRRQRRPLLGLDIWSAATEYDAVRTCAEEEPVALFDLFDLEQAAKFQLLVAVGNAAVDAEQWETALELFDAALYVDEQIGSVSS